MFRVKPIQDSEAHIPVIPRSDSLSLKSYKKPRAADPSDLVDAKSERPAVPATGIDWPRLPEEMMRMVFAQCTDDALWALARTHHRARNLAVPVLALPWRQSEMTAAARDKGEGDLLAVLRKYLPTLRARKAPYLLPRFTTIETLRSLAKLVAGSEQRPLLVLDWREDALALGEIPPQVTVRYRYRTDLPALQNTSHNANGSLQLLSFSLQDDLSVVASAVAPHGSALHHGMPQDEG